MNRTAHVTSTHSRAFGSSRLGILASLLGFTMLALAACGSDGGDHCAAEGIASNAAPGVAKRAPVRARPITSPGVEEADARVFVLEPANPAVAVGPKAASPTPATREKATVKSTATAAATDAKPARKRAETVEVARPSAAPAGPDGMTTFEVKGTFGIVAAALATGVDKRTPVGISDRFGTDTDKVWAFIKVKNRGEATTVTMVWKKAGKKVWSYDLRVGKSYGWRTWSRKSVSKRDVGEWAVDVLDAEGNLLHSMPFRITKAGDLGQG